MPAALQVMTDLMQEGIPRRSCAQTAVPCRATPPILQVMTDVIQKGSPQVQLRAMDVLLSALQHNPPQLRAFMLRLRGCQLLWLCDTL